MIKIEKLCVKAAEVLQEYGVGTFVIIAKCPDSEEFGFNKAGNKPFLIGAMDVTKILIQSEILNPINMRRLDNDKKQP